MLSCQASKQFMAKNVSILRSEVPKSLFELTAHTLPSIAWTLLTIYTLTITPSKNSYAVVTEAHYTYASEQWYFDAQTYPEGFSMSPGARFFS